MRALLVEPGNEGGRSDVIRIESFDGVEETQTTDEETELSEDVPDGRSWPLTESIYTDAMIYPLCGMEHGVQWGRGSPYFGASLLLLINICMQSVILSLLWQTVGRKTVRPGLFNSETPAFRDSRWMFFEPTTSDTGVCKLRLWDEFDPATGAREPGRQLKGGGRGSSGGGRGGLRGSDHGSGGLMSGRSAQGSLVGQYWLDCRPELLMYLTSWEVLDIDRDGLWTREEADLLNTRLAMRFYHWMRYLEHDYLSGEEPQLFEETRNFTVMPQSVFERQDYLFVLCGVMDYHKCGNLEVDGVLRVVYPHINRPLDRVDECELMVRDVCSRILSADYRIYSVRHAQLCGDKVVMKGKSDNTTVKVVEYSAVQLYDELIRSSQFAVFLSLILVIWWLSLTNEMRTVVFLAEMVAFFPGQPTETELSPVVQDEDGGNTVTYFPVGHRLYICGMVLVPRLVIVFFLAKSGSDFLSCSESYEDAILNCLALTFIIDMPEMLFTGVVAYRRKRVISTFKPLQLPHSVIETEGRHCWTPTMFYAIFNLVMACGTVWYERSMPYGWVYKAEALACFCDQQGPSCMQRWEVRGMVGETNSSAEIEAALGRSWFPSLPGWVI